MNIMRVILDTPNAFLHLAIMHKTILLLCEDLIIQEELILHF